MAQRTMKVKAVHPRLISVAGSFGITSGGLIVTTAISGKGFTPSYLGSAGQFRITFEHDFVSLVSIVAVFQDATAATDKYVQINTFEDYNGARDNYVDVSLWDTSGGDQQNEAGLIHFAAMFSNKPA